MAKILFCHPMFLSKSPEEEAAGSPYFPLGLLYLAGYVRQQRHKVAMFDATFAKDESAFATVLKQERPDLVGISALLPTREMALLLAQMAQDAGAIVVLGGPDPTKKPIFYAEQPQVDVVVHHEGEQTITALLDLFDAGELTAVSLQNELGVAFEHNGRIQINQPRPPIQNMDTLPLPARDLIDMDSYLNVWQEMHGYTSMTISTARGCPYGCEWCQEAVHGADFRQRSPENVAAEMRMIKETYKIDRLRIIDDVDGIEREWLNEWAKTAEKQDAVIPFEALNELKRKDIPLLEAQDSL
ncbi:MAG: hypothetical protein GY805_09150 [Chloroflexi bacterium]|nr:hypothetical protein [Chloroflexota bacterium]